MQRHFKIERLIACSALLGSAALTHASSSISGTVYERKAERSTPIARAFVSVRSPGEAILGTTRTDRDGRYHLVNLPAGRVVLTASKSGYVTQRAAGRAGSRVIVDCSIGCDERAADFELIPAALITGTVRDRLAQPIQKARVSIVRTNSASRREDTVSAATDDRGLFRLAGLRAGSYKLTIEGRAPGKKTETVTRSIEIDESEVLSGLDIVIGDQSMFQVAGQLLGVPWGNKYRTWITLRPIGGGRGGRNANVDMNGRFIVDSVPAGRYRAKGFSSERGSGTRNDYMLGAIDVDGDIQGLALQPIELASVSGLVEVEAGTLPTRATIVFTSNEGFGYNWFRVGESKRQFALSKMTPGSYRIHARSTDFYVKGLKNGTRLEPPDAVLLSSGSNRLPIVVSADHGRVYGTVRDPGTTYPLPHARVALQGDRGDHVVQADQTGRFLFGTVIPGDYRICAWADIAPEQVAEEAAWEAAGCAQKIIPIDPESEIEIDLRASP